MAPSMTPSMAPSSRFGNLLRRSRTGKGLLHCRSASADAGAGAAARAAAASHDIFAVEEAPALVLGKVDGHSLVAPGEGDLRFFRTEIQAERVFFVSQESDTRRGEPGEEQGGVARKRCNSAVHFIL
jgi:hypothetical protein